MRRNWYSMLAVFGLLLIGFTMLPTMVSAQDPEPATCLDANGYLEDGALSLAEQVYKAVNETDPKALCALDGLKAVAEARCGIAQEQVDVGDLENARKTYTSVLEEFGLECASNGLATLAPASCDDADRYLRDGALSLADQVFKAVNTAYPNLECAVDGLKAVAEARCGIAQEQVDAGDLENARKTYTSVLEEYGLECASNGLAKLPNKYDEVKGLVQIGDYDAAWTALKLAIETNPNGSDFTTLAEQPWARWYAFQEWLKFYAQPIAVTIFGLIVVILAGRWWYRRTRPKLDVDSFELGVVTLEPALKSDQKPDEVLIAEFEQELARLGSEANKLRRPDLIDQPIELPDFPNLESIPKGVEDVWKFVAKLIPANVVKIKGTLKSDPEKGVGLYVKLVHNRTNGLWGSYTVWQEDINPDYKPDGTSPKISTYLDLVELAAISAYWKIFQRKRRNLYRVFGTDNAQSYYIATRLAAPLLKTLPAKQTEKQKVLLKVEKMLRQKALTYDHKNYTALLNLGYVVIGLGRLNEGLEYIERAKSLTKPINPVHISANYILGIIEIEKYIANTQDKSHLEKAQKLLKEAVNNAEKNRKKRKTVLTEEYIAMLKIPYVDALWWDNVGGNVKLAKKVFAEIISERYVAARVSYNLACHFSMAAQFALQVNDPLAKALYHLRNTLRVEEHYAIQALADPTLGELRDKKKSEFDMLLAEFPLPQTPQPLPPPPTKPAALVDLVGVQRAKRLQAAKVESADDLLRNASKRQDREALAEQCAISGAHLLHWTNVVELVRVSGIEIGQVVLLEAAGVLSLMEFASTWENEELELQKKLKEQKTKLPPLDISLPDAKMLAWWIEQAKHLPTQIEQ